MYYFNDLVEAVNDKMNNIGVKRTANILNTAFEIIKAEIAAGNEVRIHNFGTFKISERAEREGRNPRTGETINIPAHKFPKFTPSKYFKDLLNS